MTEDFTETYSGVAAQQWRQLIERMEYLWMRPSPLMDRWRPPEEVETVVSTELQPFDPSFAHLVYEFAVAIGAQRPAGEIWPSR